MTVFHTELNSEFGARFHVLVDEESYFCRAFNAAACIFHSCRIWTCRGTLHMIIRYVKDKTEGLFWWYFGEQKRAPLPITIG